MDTRKYIFENGVMKLNPAFQMQQNNQGKTSTVAVPNQALTIVSSTQDAMGMPLAPTTTSAMEIMQDNDYINSFHSPQQLDGGKILDGISNIFDKYEVPLGLINKILNLVEYDLNFIIDDSGSMNNFTDTLTNQAMPYQYDPSGIRNTGASRKMTRWEEAHERLDVMIDMLTYIPNEKITISFLNRNSNITLDHRGKTLEQFAQEAHQKIAQAFSQKPSGQTPLYQKVSAAFTQAKQSQRATMFYLMTDGEPSDSSTEDLGQLIVNRANPKQFPVTLISCTNEDAQWMKDIDEAAQFTAEIDDFLSERKEVLHKQGPGLPFSKGFWLLCQLVAAINPNDLDAMDESKPFTKIILDNLMGRKLTIQEYNHYWNTNPNAQQKYGHLYQEFAREDSPQNQMVQTSQYYPAQNNQTYTTSQNSGYSNSGTVYSNTAYPQMVTGTTNSTTSSSLYPSIPQPANANTASSYPNLNPNTNNQYGSNTSGFWNNKPSAPPMNNQYSSGPGSAPALPPRYRS